MVTTEKKLNESIEE
jgi:hypothetical protein